MRTQISLFFCFLFVLSSCEVGNPLDSAAPPVTQKLTLSPTSFLDTPDWSKDDQDITLKAFARSCEKISTLDSRKPFGPDPKMGVVGDWQNICADLPDLETATAADARVFFEKWFIPYGMNAGDHSNGLFTGYYEPSLHGALQKSAKYSVPLRMRPSDLVMVDLGDFRDTLKGERIAGRVEGGKLKPYEDRAAIEDGKLPQAVDVPLLWVDSAVDAFFLQVQGSGLITFENGEEMRVGYDGQNGHLYTAIGRELVSRGELTKDNVSMQTIRVWLAAHPAEGRDLMRLNKSYVFFKRLDTDGPVGAEGVVLIPEKSLAVDPVFVPYGAPIFLDVESPEKGSAPIRSLVIAQDTGGAIKGPLRGDLFWGNGDQAAVMAGTMRSVGTETILLPRSASH